MPNPATPSTVKEMILGSVRNRADGECDSIDSKHELDIRQVTENSDRYLRGLYYPVTIGEVMIGRYRIEHKLGHGDSSTVWMARDKRGRKDVAIKIMTPGWLGEREYHSQAEISRAVPHVCNHVTFIDTFLLPGSHQSHRVFVLSLQGPNLRDFASRKSIAIRVLTAAQLLQALKCLHDGGFVHRDLKSTSIMYSLRSLENCSATAKSNFLGHPQRIPLISTLWKKGELVRPMTPHKSLVGDEVSLGDFGLAIRADISVAQKVQSHAIYCAPERFHNSNPSYASDMWSYMCLLAELYSGRPLFHGSSNASVVSSMVNVLGPLPASWKDSYNAGDACDYTWYDPDLRPKPAMTLEARIARLHPDINTSERLLMVSVLQKGLSYLPEERPTATQLLKDASFRAIVQTYGNLDLISALHSTNEVSSSHGFSMAEE
ncbi:hypothetical protein FZEAL_10178 [Fusarium zealandicum]|uniref:Protein kinase domain-containing protein n=1 Tax=Fusarium zealandicum TaxID=1053134 RepID=A0A8H4XC55_9HYPO|nr:hypothetical protein FZEAL_10178 [Fusarium zealandicum]